MPRGSTTATVRRGAAATAPFVASTAVAVWLLRHSFGSQLPAGTDVVGHLARVEYALRHRFEITRLTGWYPRNALGYQEFAIYGPGLTWMCAVVRLVALNQVSVAGAFCAVLFLGFVAIPPATAYLARSFDVPRSGAWAIGIVALSVQSDRGGGVSGLYDIGLVSQHVAIPLTLVSVGAAVRLVRGDAAGRQRTAAAFTVTSVALLVTHLPSAFLSAVVTLIAVALVAVIERPPHLWRQLRCLLHHAALVAAIAAFWLLPFIVHRDLTGYVTSFDQPSLRQTFDLLRHGKRGYAAWVSKAVAAAVVTLLVVGTRRRITRPRRQSTLLLVALAVVPLPAAFTLQHALGLNSGLGVHLNNRGLVYYLLLALLPLGLAIGVLVSRIRSESRQIAAAMVVGFLLLWSVAAPLTSKARRLDRPAAEMFTAAQYLHEAVPESARFIVHDPFAGRYELGIEAPARWLSRAADRNVANAFIPEISPGAKATMLTSERLYLDNVDGWISRVRRIAVTHIVTWDDITRDMLTTSRRVDEVFEDGRITIFALIADLNSPVGSLADVLSASDQRLTRDGFRLDYSMIAPSTSTPVAVGWSPKWHASVDGHRVATRSSPDGRLEVDLPGGTHTLELRFGPDRYDRLGLAVTLVTLGLLGVLGWRRNVLLTTMTRCPSRPAPNSVPGQYDSRSRA